MNTECLGSVEDMAEKKESAQVLHWAFMRTTIRIAVSRKYS